MQQLEYCMQHPPLTHSQLTKIIHQSSYRNTSSSSSLTSSSSSSSSCSPYAYTSPALIFSNDAVNLRYLVEYIEGISQIDDDTVLRVKNIISHFRFPVLPCFEKLYAKICDKGTGKLKAEYEQYQYDFKYILKMVRILTKPYQFFELSFFQKCCNLSLDQVLPGRKLQPPTLLQTNFLSYIHRLSKSYTKMQNIANFVINNHLNSNTYTKQHFMEQANNIMGEFMKDKQRIGFDYYGLMVFENHYVGVLDNKIKTQLENIKRSVSQKILVEVSFYSSGIMEDSSLDMDGHFGNFYECIKANAQHNKEEDNNQQFHLGMLHENQQSSLIKQSTPQAQTHSIRPFQLYLPLCCIQHFPMHISPPPTSPITTEIIPTQILPLTSKFSNMVKSSMVSLLNNQGGHIILGFRQSPENNNYYVQGLVLSQQDKQELMIYFRCLFEKIQPDVVVDKLYEIQFVPIYQNGENGVGVGGTGMDKNEWGSADMDKTVKTHKMQKITYVEGLYVVRIKVKQGNQREIYSYREGEMDKFAFRSQDGIYYLQGRKLLQTVKKIIKNSQQGPTPIHTGKCKKPHKGTPLYIQSAINFHNKQIIKSQQKQSQMLKPSLSKCLSNQIWPNNPSKITVFGLAYDFLIYNLSHDQITQIFTKQNLLSAINLASMSPNILYIRNLHSSTLKPVKNILKNLRQHLSYRYQKYRLIAISKIIRILVPSGIGNKNQFLGYLESVYVHILNNKGYRFFYQNGCEEVLTFWETQEAARVYVDLFDSGVEIQFVVHC